MNEDELQDLVANTPTLLPDVADGPIGVAREVPLGSAGRVDILIVEASGEITLVECKLRANPEIRRQVVGQALAYAAALWQSTYGELDAAFASRAGRPLASLFGEQDEEDWDEESFRAAVAGNLAEGSLRLVIAVDEITDELKRTVTFLNRHTTSALRLLALELRRAADDGVEVLILESHGEESAGEKRRRGGAARLNRERLLASVREASELAADAAAALLDWADREPRLDTRYTRARCFIETRAGPLFRLAATRWPGRIQVRLETLANRGEPGDDERVEQLVRDLADIGVNLDPDERRWPMTPLEPLADDTRRRQFLSLMERALDTSSTSP